MKLLKVSIFPLTNEGFMTSFVHPLTKRKVRERFATRVEAQAYIQSVEAKYAKPTCENYRELTIETLVVQLLSERPKCPFARKNCHLIDFLETFGRFKIDEITTDALRVWLDQVQKENSLKDITMRGLKCDVDALFTWLEEKEIIAQSPLTEVYYDRAALSLKARNLLGDTEVERLLQAVKGYSPGYLYPIVRMFAETGAKVTEVIELTWKDINLQTGTVHFKGGEKSQARTLPLSLDLVEILAKKKQQGGLVFQTYNDEPFTRAKLSRAINEFKEKKLYRKPWVPTDLRDSYAVNFLAKGGELRELQRILGHWNVFDTKRLYGEAAMIKIAAQSSIVPYE